MTLHLSIGTERTDATARRETDELVFDLVRIVQGGWAWYSDVVRRSSCDDGALATGLRDAAAALVPLAPGVGDVRPPVARRALEECRAALGRAGGALGELHSGPGAPRVRRRRRHCGAARATERAVALAVLRVAIGRALELTDAALAQLDGRTAEPR